MTSMDSSMGVIRSTGDSADDQAECAICYEELHTADISILCAGSGRRACRHFYHTKCCALIEASQIRSCPLCRQAFERTAPVPSPVKDPQGWFQAVDSDGSFDLVRSEVVDALAAVFPVDPKALERNLEALWARWDKDRNGTITYPEFVEPNQGLLQWVVANKSRLLRASDLDGAPIPDIRRSRTAWFDYWDADGSKGLDKEEVMRALLKTFRAADVGSIRNFVLALWSDFDTDNGGTIDREEFLRPGLGLLDTILANLALPNLKV